MAVNTTRMSIDIAKKDHKRLKLLADQEDMTIRDFVLSILEPVLHPERKPNETTKQAMKAARKRRTIKATDFEDLCGKLGI